jgi:hypothetical protein
MFISPSDYCEISIEMKSTGIIYQSFFDLLYVHMPSNRIIIIFFLVFLFFGQNIQHDRSDFRIKLRSQSLPDFFFRIAFI